MMSYGAGFLGYWLSRIVKRAPAATPPAAQPTVPTDADPKPLPNSRLRELAEKHRPPQSWYDETANPFEPAER